MPRLAAPFTAPFLRLNRPSLAITSRRFALYLPIYIYLINFVSCLPLLSSTLLSVAGSSLLSAANLVSHLPVEDHGPEPSLMPSHA
jgi:hypothetical protein